MTKTFEQILDEVAASHGWKDWADLSKEYSSRNKLVPVAFIKEAALLYGESKWNEACEEQMKEVYKAIGPDGKTNAHMINHWTIKPTFKP